MPLTVSALAELRLVAGPGPQSAAENTVTALGEMLSNLPDVRDAFVRIAVGPTDKYTMSRDAVGYHLREFNRLSRLDLARWPWRRKARNRWWQLYRPKAGVIEVAPPQRQ